MRKVETGKLLRSLCALGRIDGVCPTPRTVVTPLDSAVQGFDRLRKLLKGVIIETAVEQMGSNLNAILRRFAPVANEVLPEDRNPQEEIQVAA